MQAATISPTDVYKLLPKENCQKCGIATCMGFAVKLLKQEAYPSQCVVLNQAKYIQQSMKLRALLSPILKARKTKMVIYEERCNGCGNCVVVCPPNLSLGAEVSGGKGPCSNEVVIKTKDGVLKTININICRRNTEEIEAEPCRKCIDACPLNAIEFI